MSYKDYLQQRIKELEFSIANNAGQVDALKEELRKLQVQEFEEDLREQAPTQTLLKG